MVTRSSGSSLVPFPIWMATVSLVLVCLLEAGMGRLLEEGS